MNRRDAETQSGLHSQPKMLGYDVSSQLSIVGSVLLLSVVGSGTDTLLEGLRSATETAQENKL